MTVGCAEAVRRRSITGSLGPRCHLRQDRRVSSLRDYEEWHARYDDPDSDLSWRLQTVRRFIEDALVRHQGPMRILSSCAGDGRDVLGVLSDRDDVNRITVTLLEVHPRIANQARAAAAALPVAGVEVRAVDAGGTDAYAGAVPAELILMVGIFGNICDADLRRTIATTPQFCQPGGTLLWSRAREGGDRNAEVRASFGAAGFTELDYETTDIGSRPAVGAMRYDGPFQPLVAGKHLFTFRR